MERRSSSGMTDPRRYPAVTSTSSLAVEHLAALARSRSPSQAATTTVATQLPIRLPSARAMPMNQSTDSTSTRPIAGNARHRVQRRGQDHDRRARHAVRALRGDQRDAEHQQQIAERQRRVGRLRDEHHGERQVDREGVEVEGIAGRDDEPDDGILDAEPLQLAHDLRQHRVGRGGREHDGQFLAQIGEEFEDVEPGERHHAAEHAEHEDGDRDVEQRDQRDQLLERADAVFADGVGDRAEHAERRNAARSAPWRGTARSRPRR